MGSSPTRGSSFFLGKVTALGVLCCFALFVCLTLLASFFLPSHLSLTTCIYLRMSWEVEANLLADTTWPLAFPISVVHVDDSLTSNVAPFPSSAPISEWISEYIEHS